MKTCGLKIGNSNGLKVKWYMPETDSYEFIKLKTLVRGLIKWKK